MIQRLKVVKTWGLGTGILAGALLTAPLMGLMYLLDQLAGFPFVPFALFDWIARVLPGPLVTFGIDLMIDGLRLVGLSVADAAKTGEKIMAVLLFFSIGTAAGAVYFGVNQAKNRQPQIMSGLVLGFVVGLPLSLISAPRATGNLPASLVLLGLLLLFLAWGAAIFPVYQRLTRTQPAVPSPQPSQEHVRSVEVLNRRQFLIKLGATTATITVLSGGLGTLLAQSERQRLDSAIANSMAAGPG